MQLNPYLAFNGDCEAAFKFYEQVFRGKTLMTMRYGESPMATQTPPDWRNKIMHTRMSIGDVALMGSDAPPDRYQKPQGVMVSVGIDAPPEAERVFQALSEGGVVTMPIQETFWAQRFGMLTDRFGIPWMVNCEKPQ
ncbi:MAG TPA: VOC family protein [Alphaproteobacteria bacterium]